MASWNRNKNTHELLVIKTARDVESINEAVKNGYRPLIKKVEPSKNIRSKYSVIQDKETGKIEIITDFRTAMERENEIVTIIDWSFYYPHSFKSPFAAYIIPPDIKIGEQVYIEDLIEDFIGTSWNQGDTFRLESCEASWNGTDLEIQYDLSTTLSNIIG